MTLLDRMKGAFRKMVGKDTIVDILKVKPAISLEMEKAIQDWTAMYEDRASWLKQPTDEDPNKVVSLGLPSLIASEKARMATIEMESEITAPMADVEVDNPDYEPPGIDEETGLYSFGKGSMTITESQPTGPTERADYLNSQYTKVLDAIRTQLEYGCAKGGLVIKPYVRMYEEGVESISNEVSNENVEESQNPALQNVEKQSSFSANSDVAKKDKEENTDEENTDEKAPENENEAPEKEQSENKENQLPTGESFEGDTDETEEIGRASCRERV